MKNVICALSLSLIFLMAGCQMLVLQNGDPKSAYITYVMQQHDQGKAKILWQPPYGQDSVLRWGTDTDYSEGEVTVDGFMDVLRAYTIENIDPEVKYFYKLNAGNVTYRGSFRLHDDPDALKFLVYGDTRSNPKDHDRVSRAMLNLINNDSGFQTFLLHSGDLVRDGDSELAWEEEFFSPDMQNHRVLMASVPIYASMGNHEKKGRLFQRYFPYSFVDDRYWSFDYGPAHVAVIDQQVDYRPGSDQHKWLKKDLSTTKKTWKFLLFHYPGWSAKGHENDTQVQNVIHPLCVDYGVDIVFAGHNHYYSRAVVDGIQHVTAGGGGAEIKTPKDNEGIVAMAADYHYCRIEISGDQLLFKAVNPQGIIIDEFTMTDR